MQSQEDQFILAAARLNLSESQISKIQDLCEKGLAWPRLTEIACTHQVGTFIYYSLSKAGLIHLLPDSVTQIFRSNFHRVTLLNTRLLHEFDRLSNIIPHRIIPLKGIDLIQTLYPELGIRYMGDMDILIEKKYALNVWNTLLTEEYKPVSAIAKSDRHGIHNPMSSHLPSLIGKDIAIEVHWNLFRGSQHFELCQDAWGKAIPVSGNTFRLPKEYLLIHLCTHFCKHLQSRVLLRMVCDINEIVSQKEDPIDWDEINHIICHQALRKNMLRALSYSNKLMGTPIPDDWMLKELLNQEHISISALVEKDNSARISSIKIFFRSLREVKNLADRIVFVYRTLIPVKSWMEDKYGELSGVRIFKAYISYWIYLINRHIFKKDIEYAFKGKVSSKS